MSRTIPAARLRGRRSRMYVAALSLPLLVVGACGTGNGTTAPDGSSRPTGSTTGTGPSQGTAGGNSQGTSQTPSPSTGAGGGTSTTTGTAPSTSASSAPQARSIHTAVYFLHGEHISAAPRTVAAPSTVSGAVRALLAGPNRSERHNGRGTAIPSGTTLHSVAVRDHLATVDLSGRYDDGGGTLSMRARLAQVVFTVTRFSTLQKVRFEIDGKPVKHFGGEGIVLDHPLGRADFEDLTPAVLIESPLIGDTVRTPLRVWGTANTFEAVFRLKVTDTTGRTAADVRVRATSGTGTRGTFDVTFPFKAARTGPGLLTAYFNSPKDGKPVTVDTIPLTVHR
ncbi:Gmad2 immunoglobulin-like domain-containing protein [Streptomyces sp. NPDC004546]|uniref:GerMN domain-containing protein n=1 Tax=Streptomyces sp. NPDC004546 TaxID=3154282 RepID=UPI0033A33900